MLKTAAFMVALTGGRLAIAAALPLSVQISDGTNSQTIMVEGQLLSDARYQANGTALSPTWALTWDIQGRLGPNHTDTARGIASFEADLSITNLTGVPQTYFVTTTMAVGSIVDSLLAGASGGRLEDLNRDTVTLTTNPTTQSLLTTFLVDGSFFTGLNLHPTTRMAPAGGVLEVSPQSFAVFAVDVIPPRLEGLPAVSGPDIFSTIGIREEFTLTPGDRWTAIEIFRTQTAIPEPSTIWLSILGAVALACAGFARRSKQ